MQDLNRVRMSADDHVCVTIAVHVSKYNAGEGGIQYCSTSVDHSALKGTIAVAQIDLHVGSQPPMHEKVLIPIPVEVAGEDLSRRATVRNYGSESERSGIVPMQDIELIVKTIPNNQIRSSVAIKVGNTKAGKGCRIEVEIQ